ncbi:uncharacterized protein LOC116844498 [Odontomachus brunneus]|uniref:uncharacterized protein LOC116844498 n=1 Tax=Odontomachus brunneus TaxID=486640 RepID=UPI0013F1CC4F|nr:uncharacterized protein LOC116844498 [Odontomachus brunneus]
MFKGGLEQSSDAQKDSPSVSSVVATTGSKVLKSNITEDEKNAVQLSTINPDSSCPYANRKYVQSGIRDALQRNVKRQTAAISPQDLHESFVESLDWRGDFDDDTKARFGRGLKAVEEVPVSRTNETRERADKSHVANATASSEPREVNSLILQNRHCSAITKLTNVLDAHRDVADRRNIEKTGESIPTRTIGAGDDGDLETAEQKYANHRTPRIRRARAAHRAFYDDLDESPADRLRPSDVLEDRSDGMYRGYASSNRQNDLLDRYLKRKRENSGKANDNKKKSELSANTSGRHAKKGSSHSSWNNRRNRARHRSDMSKNANRGDWRLKKNKGRKPKESRAGVSRSSGRGSSQKSRMADQESLRAGLNEVPSEKVLYENAEDQSVSVKRVGDDGGRDTRSTIASQRESSIDAAPDYKRRKELRMIFQTVKPAEYDARRKEITLLLAADNVDDESQMDVALRGELAGKIVQQTFAQASKG